MKKALVIIVIMFLSAGMLAAFTLSDSTITVGGGFDTISGTGRDIFTDEKFSSSTSGGLLYLFYDLKLGQTNWYSRLGYEYLLFPGDYVFKNTTYTKDSGYKRSASKNRGGVYYAFKPVSKIKLCLGASITEISMTLTDKDYAVKQSNSFFAIGLIADCLFMFTERFGARLSLCHDFIFFAMDRYRYAEKTYEIVMTQSEFSGGYALGARIGLSYQF